MNSMMTNEPELSSRHQSLGDHQAGPDATSTYSKPGLPETSSLPITAPPAHSLLCSPAT